MCVICVVVVMCGVIHLKVDVSDYDISRGRLCAASLSIASYVWYNVVTASNIPVPDPIVPVMSANILSDAMRTAPDTEAMNMYGSSVCRVFSSR